MFQYTKWMRTNVFLLTFFVFVGLSFFLPYSMAQEVDPTVLQAQIDDQNAKIAQLKSEIAQLQVQLDATGKQKLTLQSAVKALDLNIKKLTASISLTQAQITQKDREIANLSSTITTTSGEIGQAQEEVAGSLRQVAVADAEPLFVSLLGGDTLSSIFDNLQTLSSLRVELVKKVDKLSALESKLKNNKSTAETKRSELAKLKANLNQEKRGVAIARAEQNKLLQDTKNQESAYQAQIAQKRAQETQFEQDLLRFEAQLGLTTSLSAIPPAGSGVLQWPVDVVRITQYFGNTAFATQNPSVYSGHGHTGIDLAASPGTPIKAARGGVVLGTGNTDVTCTGASYGKWIFVKHENGLSTIYAHLSVMLVSEGDSVEAGQVIAYSDTTGYATGPHLHFGVYATQGSKIASWPTQNPRVACRGKIYTMPVGDLQAYLNPLSYLPAVPK